MKKFNNLEKTIQPTKLRNAIKNRKNTCSGCQQTVYPEYQWNIDAEKKDVWQIIGKDGSRIRSVFAFKTT
jgi:predicted Fe-S protein YdhL (DUF1289 family)